MDPARAFNLNCRMETSVLGSSGTKGSGTGFSFPLVVDCTSTFIKFRSAISEKYPWGLYDAVEIRYWDMENTAWVPVQCDDELAIMFGTYAESKSAEIEINVIQRSRGEIERRTTRSQANNSQARCS